jgi:hypothetical protein
MNRKPELLSRKKEPIFGPQAGSFFRQLVTLAFALGLVLVVLLLAVYTKDGAQRLLYGETSHTRPTLQPGESATIDGVTIKRIN